MLTKIDRPADSDEALSSVRPAVERLVRSEEYVTGSRMLAYANVGYAIGKSASWVRKLLGNQDVGLRYFDALNIARAYEAVCERVEAAAAAERLRAEQLRRLVDAPVERAAGVVAGPEGPRRR